MSSNLPLATIMAIAKLHDICHLLFRKTHAICQHLKRVEKKTKSEMKAAVVDQCAYWILNFFVASLYRSWNSQEEVGTPKRKTPKRK